MSIRIHTTEAKIVTTATCSAEQINDLYRFDEPVDEGGLVIEDTYNLEAMLLLGTNEEIAAFAHEILARLNTPVKPDNESAVTVSLAPGGATYEIYGEMFKIIAGTLPWQREHGSGGWNVTLNGETVQVVSVDDEGVIVRPALDEDFETFGDSKALSWDDVATIVIL